MDQINGALEALLTAIRESDEYKNYQDIKRRLHEKPEVEKRVNEFRKRNFERQNRKDIDLYEEIDRLEAEKSKISENPLAAEYLAAELAFCRIIQKINWKFLEELDFEVDFEVNFDNIRG